MYSLFGQFIFTKIKQRREFENSLKLLECLQKHQTLEAEFATIQACFTIFCVFDRTFASPSTISAATAYAPITKETDQKQHEQYTEFLKKYHSFINLRFFFVVVLVIFFRSISSAVICGQSEFQIRIQRHITV